jgi:hypothetical protein
MWPEVGYYGRRPEPGRIERARSLIVTRGLGDIRGERRWQATNSGFSPHSARHNAAKQATFIPGFECSVTEMPKALQQSPLPRSTSSRESGQISQHADN